MHNDVRKNHHEEPLRVLWVVHWYPSVVDTTAGSFHRTQVEALHRAGIAVEVVAPTPWVPPFLDRAGEKWREYREALLIETFGGVRIYRPRYLSHPGENLRGFPHLTMRYVIERLRLTPPDIVHAHCAYPPGMTARDLARKWGIPWVLTLHGTDVNIYPHANATAARRFQELVTGADAVLAVSRALSTHTAQLTGVMPEAVPVGVDLRAYADLPTRAAARKELDLPPDKWIVLFVGRLTAEKGVGELLRALARLEPEGVLGVFVGVGELARAIQRAPGALLAGKQPNERVPLFLSAADAMILPSYHEGLPTVLVEAGAAGAPIIATDIDGSRELVRDGRGYLIEPRSTEAIVRALEAVRDNPHDAQLRGRAMHAFIGEHYNADRSAERIGEIYRKIAARGPAGSMAVDRQVPDIA